MASRFFSARFFAARFFKATGAEQGFYFGSRYFAARYFKTQYFRPGDVTDAAIIGNLGATENADTLSSSATISAEESRHGSFVVPRHPPQLEPILAWVDVEEKPDTCEATAILGFDPVAMDNDWLLVAA